MQFQAPAKAGVPSPSPPIWSTSTSHSRVRAEEQRSAPQASTPSSGPFHPATWCLRWVNGRLVDGPNDPWKGSRGSPGLISVLLPKFFLFVSQRTVYQLTLLISFFLFAFSRATPMAYGGSQARGPITSLHQSHSNEGCELCLRPIPQLMATPDPGDLSKARDQTRNLMVPSRIR